MGELNRHPVAKWRRDYNLAALVETGTWRGDGVITALSAGFNRVVTVDVDPKALTRAAERATKQYGDCNLDCVLGDSAEVMPEVVRSVGPLPVLWWLDAHYPEQYSATTSGAKHPLLAEVRAIVQAERDHSRDVFLADDLRIYGETGTSGPLPVRSNGAAGTRSVFLEPGRGSDLEQVVDLLAPTHIVRFVRRDGCYLVAAPRKGGQ